MYLKDIDVFLCDNSNYLIDIYTGDMFLLNNRDTFLDIYKGKIVDGNEDIKQFISQNKSRGISCKEAINVVDINTIRINVSNDCNLNCKYCYADGGNYKKEVGLMDISTATEVVRFIENYFPNVETIFFFGGEPLLNIEIIEFICEHLSEKYFKLITNGFFINDKIIEVIKKYDIKIGISIDGPENIHDEFRVTKSGAKTFRKICQNINKLQENGISLTNIQSTYTEFAERQMKKSDLVDYFIQNFDFKFLTIGDDVTEKWLDLIKDEDVDSIEIFKKTDKIILDLAMNVILASKIVKANGMKCGAGNELILIHSNGNIYPCQRFISDKEFIMSNIYNFNMEKFLQKKKEFDDKYVNNSKCSGCLAKYVCNVCLSQINDISEVQCKLIEKACEQIYNKLPEYLNDDSLMELIEKNLEKYM